MNIQRSTPLLQGIRGCLQRTGFLAALLVFISVSVVEAKEVVGWRCKFKNHLHTSPEQCSRPDLGGEWVYGDSEDEKWQKELDEAVKESERLRNRKPSGELPPEMPRFIPPPPRFIPPRNEDTRISPSGRINSASAAEQLLTSSGLPCTEYTASVVGASGINTRAKLPGKNYTIRDAINMNSKVLPEVETNDDLDGLVRDEDRRTKGVVNALVATGNGKEIDISEDVSTLRRGDIVQYWYVKNGKRMGHTAVVTAAEDADGKLTMKGSQQGSEETFKTTLKGSDYRYAVRPSR